ncbi:chorismate-binding protein [Lacihabitans soyangensis]|uniref:isochorismate synthase n=1 Tax=Lacihabitans soyangensis TaxID=869394 RepID=A0AAE3H419_9BACT|nr:chorismate-binding protein [Lacihabitans soyangensis]MCP9764749.1 isochorismate synthase [Lacihabitans soyangensis]
MIATESSLHIDVFLNSCVEQKIPFALYKLPNTAQSKLIVSFEKTEVRKKIDFDECGSGFVMAPYHKENELPYFYKNDFEVDFEDITEIEVPEDLRDLLGISKTNLADKFSLKLKSENTNSDSHKRNVEEVINSIQKGEAKKVVLSRTKHLGEITENNFFRGFQNLSKSNPTGFVSLVNVPWKNQVWLGASPEILVSQDENGMFKTVSLAGTQSAFDKDGNEIRPIDALWSHKEIEEQAFVGRYIINCLKKIRVREFLEEGPKTIKAGNLLHLNTSYTIDTKEINFGNLSSVMLNLLHPTPAVCGMPKDAAEAIIDRIEDYDREFYSGYLGPVNIQNRSQLFVNIRTMKIENGQVFAFAGGGITEDSDPEKEWNETEIKLQTILKSFS